MYGYPNIANNYNPQPSIDRINSQMAELEKMKQQLQQPIQQPQMPTNLTQNFQLTPTNREVIKYASSIDEVNRDMVIGDTPYFSKDMSVVWIKNTKGDIKTYELNEIIPKDSKDLMIESLQMELNELRGRLSNEQYATNDDEQLNETSTPKDDGTTRATTQKSKPTSVSRVSTSKTK